MKEFPKAAKNGVSVVCTQGHKWQRRFWEHLIRDETDFRQHIDYIHWNPVKHGWAESVKDWPHSSFHRYVKQGIYSVNWSESIDLPELSAGE